MPDRIQHATARALEEPSVSPSVKGFGKAAKQSFADTWCDGQYTVGELLPRNDTWDPQLLSATPNVPHGIIGRLLLQWTKKDRPTSAQLNKAEAFDTVANNLTRKVLYQWLEQPYYGARTRAAILFDIAQEWRLYNGPIKDSYPRWFPAIYELRRLAKESNKTPERSKVLATEL